MVSIQMRGRKDNKGINKGMHARTCEQKELTSARKEWLRTNEEKECAQGH